MIRKPLFSLLSCLIALPTLALGQNLVFNPSFELGTNAPLGWSWIGSLGTTVRWENGGRTGSRSVSVQTANIFDCGLQWRTSTNVPYQPNQPYLLRFWGMSTNTGAVAYAGIGDGGINVVNRFMGLDNHWRPHDFIAVAPTALTTPLLRIAQCNSVGYMLFDDAEVRPVRPVHVQVAGQVLGVAESVRGTRYVFWPYLGDYESRFTPAGFRGNYSRPLQQFNGRFDNYYWTLNAGNSIVHRYQLPGLIFTNAQARIATIRQQGQLLVDFSADGSNWVLGTNYWPTFTGYLSFTNLVPVPAELLPATNLFARVRGGTNALNYLLVAFGFEADLSTPLPDTDGETWFFELERDSAQGQPLALASGSRELSIGLRNPGPDSRPFSLQWLVEGPAGTRLQSLTNEVSAGQTNVVAIPVAGVGDGENWLNLQIEDLLAGTNVFSAKARFRETILRDASYGYLLPGQTNCALWWCEATYKVGRERVLPAATNQFVSIEAARNEYEPFQIVLRPEATLSNLSVALSAFVALEPTNAFQIAATNVEVAFVEYVPVVIPSDYSGTVGDHPDPLIPLTGTFDAPAGNNQPLWFTLYVPKDAPGGEYAATVTIQSPDTHLAVPVRLRVFDFSLSDVTHTRTAFNVNVDSYWHGMNNDTQKVPVWDLYMENFRKHRVSPYAVQQLGNLTWSLLNGPDGPYFTHNFANFDASMTRYLDEFGMNSSGLTYVPHSIGGHQRFTTGYRQLYPQLIAPIMQHVREKGWLEKVYCYWDDEPSTTRFPFTIEGMQVVQEASPGLKRLLTVNPRTEFDGHVDVWVPYAGYFDPNALSAREAAGEEIWWYVSGGPGAPYSSFLTDHPAISPRMRFWGGEKYNLTGELYWHTTWYIGTGNAPINPWTNTLMRFANGGASGNGNGVLLYPPTKTPPAGPLVAGPWNSLRWEIVREALEDREYFWLLKQAMQRVKNELGDNHPLVLTAQQVREDALALVKSKTNYDNDPQKLYAARRAVAGQIELLDDGAVMIVRDPTPRAVSFGETHTLRSEAIGWPLPAYQWQHYGTNVPGATQATLTLTNMNSAHLGEWRVVASNTVGVATSAVARLGGYWVNEPQIIAQSAGDLRRVGDRTVLEVTAVSALPVTYAWYRNGVLVTGATNNTLSLLNLEAADGGYYMVVMSNAAGVATSAPMSLSTMPSYTAEPPGLTGDWVGPGVGYELELPVDNRPRTVLASTNLTHWSPLFSVPPSGLPTVTNDPAATNLPYRYYRVRTE